MKRNNNSKMVYLASMIFTFFLPMQIFAGEPTKKETIDFILKKADNVNDSYYKQSLSFDGCGLVIKSTSIKFGFTMISYIDFSKLDPSKVISETGDYFVWMETKERKQVIKNEWTNDPKVLYTLFAKFFTNSSDDAGKVAKALRHLIKLCGGTEELF